MRFGWDLLLGAVLVAVLLLIVEILAKATGASFFGSVILGHDKRTSTSKTFIFMWTLLVAWALVSLVIAGEVLDLHRCANHADLTKATHECLRIHDKLGLLQVGWHRFLSTGLVGSYLVLLGIPGAAGVAAKAITQSKVTNGSLAKSPADPSQTGFATRITQVFSADDGTTDIGDFQYVIFNLLTAAYFVAHFIRDPGSGLPSIPDSLLVLTGASAALYVGKKATDQSKPTITGVIPTTLSVGQAFAVTGTSLTGGPAEPAIAINGRFATSVRADPNVPDRLHGIVPDGILPPGAQTPAPGTLEVSSSYGAITDSQGIQCV